MRRSSGIALRIGLILCALAAAASGGMQSRPDRRPPSPAASLRRAINELIREARLMQQEQRLVRADADFARGFDGTPARAAVGRALVRPAHRDPLVDAYVRWQLTGFELELPRLGDRAFETFVTGLPELPANPRADPQLVAALTRVNAAGALDPAEQAAVETRLDELGAATSRARSMRRPARALRRWLRDRHEDAPARRLRLDLEACGALVDAGWSCDDAKAALDEAFAEASGRDLTDEQRQLVALAAQGLMGRSQLLVQGARLEDGALAVTFTDTGVYDFDVSRWLRSLARLIAP